MRLEERIVLDGAAAVVVEHAAQAMVDVHVVDTDNDANPVQDSHEAKDTAQADSGTAETTDVPDVAALLKAVASQDNQIVNAASPTKDKTVSSAPEDSPQPEEDPVTVLVASSGLADVNDLVGAAKDNVITVTYDGDTDNSDDIFNKIESALDGKQAASIGFASHSIGSGSIHLGGDYSVDADTLLSNPEMTEFWKNVGSLVESDGHIDLLGCGVADGEVGKDFITKLEQITGREIAASIDDTGNAESGGNWLLEEGGVDLAQVYFVSGKLGGFDGVLATSSVTIELDSGGASQTLYDVDGDGYYEIDTVGKLIALSQTKNKGTDWARNYELTADISFDADQSSVDWDGDGTVGDADDAKGFKSIGRITFAVTGGGISVVGYNFSGNFDGNGHKVSNLFINRTDGEIGLFGWVANASLSNIKVAGAEIGGGYRTGALAGYIQQTIITNCSATGSVSGGNAVGGLIGYTFLANTISSSSAVCNVSGGSYVGGLVGSMDSSGHTTVSDSFAEGTVTSTDSHAGGLVGSMGATGSARIENSHAKTTVTGANHVGGLVGSMEAKDKDSSIYNSYAEGQVIGSGAFIGGLVGFINGDKSSSISQSHATGKVIATGGGASMAIGGLLGGTSMRAATSTIQNCYASGDVSAAGASAAGGFVGSLSNSAVSSSYASGNVLGAAWVGGLVGNLVAKTTVENSYATGNVTGTLHSTGGLVGKMGSNDESGDCSISTSYASGVVTGIDYVGGLVGGIDDSADTMNITNCYAIGNVKGQEGVGGLVGTFTGVGLGKISKSSALEARVEGINFTGRVVGRNWGTLEDNRANLIMETEGWTVADADKGANTKDGADYAAYPYHVYRTWDTAVWDFPAEKSDNVILKNAGAKAVAPAVNHAPTVAAESTMTAILENTTSYNGQTVASLIPSLSGDVDGDTLGIAVTSADNDHGEWQYYDNSSSSWKAIGRRTDAGARTLKSTDRVRFIPEADWTGTANINFRIWDGTDSADTGHIVDASTNGGSTAYSADQTFSTITVKENSAPTLTGSVAMNPIIENTTDPAGQTVSSLIGSVAGDADGNGLGIAVTNVNDTGGEWQYFSSGSWRSLDTAIGSSAAFLLSGADKIRFKPDAGWKGNAYLSFRAWDGTEGGVHRTVSSIGTEASSAFSSGQKIMRIKVNAAPVVEKPDKPQIGEDTVTDIVPDPKGEKSNKNEGKEKEDSQDLPDTVSSIYDFSKNTASIGGEFSKTTDMQNFSYEKKDPLLFDKVVEGYDNSINDYVKIQSDQLLDIVERQNSILADLGDDLPKEFRSLEDYSTIMQDLEEGYAATQSQIESLEKSKRNYKAGINSSKALDILDKAGTVFDAVDLFLGLIEIGKSKNMHELKNSVNDFANTGAQVMIPLYGLAGTLTGIADNLTGVSSEDYDLYITQLKIMEKDDYLFSQNIMHDAEQGIPLEEVLDRYRKEHKRNIKYAQEFGDSIWWQKFFHGIHDKFLPDAEQERIGKMTDTFENALHELKSRKIDTHIKKCYLAGLVVSAHDKAVEIESNIRANTN